MRPLLAATIKNIETDVKFPCLASPKFDGVRCLAFNGSPMSRSFKPLPNRALQSLFCNRLLHGFDGELVIGEPTAQNCFNVTTSAIMSYDATLIHFQFYVFDDFSMDGPYIARLKRLYERVHHLDSPFIQVVEQTVHDDVASLTCHEEDTVREGYEGLIIRSFQGKYKQGRSTLNEQYMLKLKRFTDAEAVCVGYTELKRNNNEPTVSETGYQVRSSHQANMINGQVLGALTCRWEPTGELFNVGTGFSASDRVSLWDVRERLKGQLVKFKYQSHGVKDLPRLPVFVGFRSPEDL